MGYFFSIMFALVIGLFFFLGMAATLLAINAASTINLSGRDIAYLVSGAIFSFSAVALLSGAAIHTLIQLG